MSEKTFGYGAKPRMKEVPAGTEAIFSFNGEPEIVETDYGEKFSFPITLISHDSYPQLNDPSHPGYTEESIEMAWESKSVCAKQLYNDLNDSKTKYHKELKEAYKNDKWQLTRFDNGAYFISVAP